MKSITIFRQSTPTNAARYFESQRESMEISPTYVNLAICEMSANSIHSPSISLEEFGIQARNITFDPALIHYDDKYLTTVARNQENLSFLLSIITNLLPRISKVYEIGCGQGEFIKTLKEAGLSAGGCDPVFRGKDEFIKKEFFTHRNGFSADLYVLRCVLPHLANPFNLVDYIFENDENARILFTFPSIDWILSSSSWASITYDHVNYFSLKGIALKYKILKYGRDYFGEWNYCIIQKNSSQKPRMITNELVHQRRRLESRFSKLQIEKVSFLEAIKKTKKKVIVWGAAGKGAVIALNLQQLGLEPVIVDLDENKQGRFLECSGLRVMSPLEVDFTRRRQIVVAANHTHKPWIQEHFFKPVITLKDYNLIR